LNTYSKKIAQELGIPVSNVQATIALLDEGATIPFISRYRKEATGSLDEVVIAQIRDRAAQLKELDRRRESILHSIREQNKLTPELEQKIREASTLVALEDIYLPFKPRRRSRATIAREKGLEPLAALLFEQAALEVMAEAEKYVDASREVNNVEEALAGARDIMAEWMNENPECREKMRALFLTKATFKSKVIPGKEEEGLKYKDYFDWEEPVSKAPSHRILALRRAEKELILLLDILPPEEEALLLMESLFIKGNQSTSAQVRTAIKDCYKRLLKSSVETEVRLLTKANADKDAIRVFSDNIRQLLLAAPLGQKNILAIDPGFRSGCKVVCLDRQGKLLENTAIFPHEPQKRMGEAAETIRHLVEKHAVEAIGIGNGTAGRETELFVRSLKLSDAIQIVMVNESGASVYSASEVAREEFPEYDVTVRGAVSIGRRLMDPLAELVKIDPKSIGVGQYQHDVDQSQLKHSLDDVVMSCVNGVGVEVNTASKQILSYVSGLGPQLAQNIVEYRNANGPFKNRQALKKVPRMGDKAFEQAAGFLRIRNSDHPLDGSAVHPESYHIIDKMASDMGTRVGELIRQHALTKSIQLQNYVSEKVGIPTLRDILEELAKPGRDPREQFESFSFTEGVDKIEDLRPGMKLPGLVTNITKFGAFVDIGVHQDGLIHISHLSDRFVSDANQVVKVQQKVMVTVLEVDVQRKRISLSMKGEEKVIQKKQKPGKAAGEDISHGAEEDMATKLSKLAGKFRN
jgi:uncharacterized protein